MTSIDVFSWLGGREVTVEEEVTDVREVLGSIPGFGKDFYVCFFVLFLFFCPKSFTYIIFCILFRNVNSFSLLKILQKL